MDHRKVFVRSYLKCHSQDDSSIVDRIKNEYLVPFDGSEYNFTKPVDELDKESTRGEVGQPVEVENWFTEEN